MKERFIDKYSEREWNRIWKRDLYNVFDNKWRVNLWSKTKIEGSICDRTLIEYSYFIAFHEEEGILWTNPEI